MSHPDLREINGNHSLGIMGSVRVNHDLVINPVTPQETARHQLTYQGGPTLQNPEVFCVFIDNFWDDWNKVDSLARDLVEGGYLQPLRELGYRTGPGTYRGPVQIYMGLSGQTLYDSQVKRILVEAIQAGEIPQPSSTDTLYCLIMPSNMHILFDGDTQGNCGTWCGYHSHAVLPDGRLIAYSVQPETTCAPCHGAQTPFDAFAMVLAHEIAEACTDPQATGWWDTRDGSENADIVAWQPLNYGPWIVQGYFTNERGNTIGDYVSAQPPQPQPQPGCESQVLQAGNKVINDLIIVKNRLPLRYTQKRADIDKKIEGVHLLLNEFNS